MRDPKDKDPDFSSEKLNERNRYYVPPNTVASHAIEGLSVSGIDSIIETLSPVEQLIYASIMNPILLDEFAHETDDYSPTPADPASVETADDTYVEASLQFMLDKNDRVQAVIMDKMLKEVALGLMSAEDASTILLGLADIKTEITNQHQRQLHKNFASTQRLQTLFYMDTSRFKPPVGEPIDTTTRPIERVRAGLDETEQRARFLALYPEAASVEDMKFTTPLDIQAFNKARNIYFAKLKKLDIEHADIDVHLVPSEQRQVWPKDVSDSAPEGVEVRRIVVATIKIGVVEIEVVEHSTLYAFPLGLQVPGTRPHRAKRLNGEMANLQPITISMYLRVKGVLESEPSSDGEAPSDQSRAERMVNYVLRILKGPQRPQT